jgi:hypothetical protein
MTTFSTSHTLYDVTNTSVAFLGLSDRLTFIGSSSSGVVAEGSDQTVAVANDSWLVVQNDSSNDLNVLIQGSDSHITINDINQNMKISLYQQGAYTISDDTTGPIPGAFIDTAHSSLFVMYANAATLAHSVHAVG